MIGSGYAENKKRMKILMVASEAEPYSKTGGLADVIGALPRALARLGHEVAVVTPLYRSVSVENPRVDFPSLTISFGTDMHFPRIVSVRDRGVQIFFVDYPEFFDRAGYYGGAAGDYPDNPERFTLLCRVAIEIAKLTEPPDLFHCHDWQAAMLPVLLKSVFSADSAVRHIPVLLTVHNLGYHGYFTPDVMDRLGLPPTLFTITGLEYYGHVNFLKGGLLFADHLSTVSEGYAREIQTPEYGHSLDGILRQRSAVLHGIVNGVDYSQWNPQMDPYIAERYSADSLDGKRACKRALLAAMGLPADSIDRPLIGMVTRLAVQKVELLVAAGDRLMERDMALAVLGSGEKPIQDFLIDLKTRYPEKVGLTIGYDEALAHQIEAGADMFLMPSRYEPCGLNQMYSLKYGTPPIVRATGGLDDTIEPFDAATGEGTGFKFWDYTAEAMLLSIDEALRIYSDRDLWLQLVRNGMQKDFSWDVSAKKYVQLYKLVAATPAG